MYKKTRLTWIMFTVFKTYVIYRRHAQMEFIERFFFKFGLKYSLSLFEMDQVPLSQYCFSVWYIMGSKP